MSHSPNTFKVAIVAYYYTTLVYLIWSVKRCFHQGNDCLALQRKQIDVLRSVPTVQTKPAYYYRRTKRQTDESTERPAKQESILLYEKITDMLQHNTKV